MRNRSARAAALFAGLFFALATPFAAAAQTVGIAVPIIPSEQAQVIAAANGTAVINKLELDEGKWKIEGRDVGGRYISMKIDARSGEILELYRDH
jgi:uncharacterized membrane protein YkoI